jgi:hypothetical protein
MQTDKQKDGWAGGKTGRREDGRTNRRTERQADRRRDRQTDGETGRRTDWQAGRQADKQTDRQTDRLTDGQAGTWTDRSGKARSYFSKFSYSVFKQKWKYFMYNAFCHTKISAFFDGSKFARLSLWFEFYQDEYKYGSLVTVCWEKKTEILGENLSRHHFVYHKPTWIFSGIKLGPLRSEAGDEPKVYLKICLLPQSKQTSFRS